MLDSHLLSIHSSLVAVQYCYMQTLEHIQWCTDAGAVQKRLRQYILVHFSMVQHQQDSDCSLTSLSHHSTSEGRSYQKPAWTMYCPVITVKLQYLQRGSRQKSSWNLIILTQHSALMLIQDRELCYVCQRMGSIGWVCCS